MEFDGFTLFAPRRKRYQPKRLPNFVKESTPEPNYRQLINLESEKDDSLAKFRTVTFSYRHYQEKDRRTPRGWVFRSHKCLFYEH